MKNKFDLLKIAGLAAVSLGYGEESLSLGCALLNIGYGLEFGCELASRLQPGGTWWITPKLLLIARAIVTTGYCCKGIEGSHETPLMLIGMGYAAFRVVELIESMHKR